MPRLAVGGSVLIAELRASAVISHLDGNIAFAFCGMASHAVDAVVGGGLHVIEPLRSITNRMFVGSSADSMLAVAQLPLKIAAAVVADGDAVAPALPLAALPLPPPLPPPLPVGALPKLPLVPAVGVLAAFDALLP